MEALNDAQISVYPVDVRGLDPTYDEPPAQAIARNPLAQNELQVSTIENLKAFADMTGGRAFYNSNDLFTGFRQATDDSSSYYLLGYYLNSKSTKPGWRKLQVRLERRGEEVHARRGYFVGSATMNAEATHKADVNFALSSPLESTGIPILVRWNPSSMQPGHRARPEFAIVVPADGIINESDRNRFDVDFVWEADRSGTSAQRDGQTIKGSLDSASLARIKKEGIFYKNSLKLPAGEYRVHFVVRDNLSGRIGSVTAPLTVD